MVLRTGYRNLRSLSESILGLYLKGTIATAENSNGGVHKTTITNSFEKCAQGNMNG